MATPYLLIDGYNLLHGAGLARQTYGPGDLERCRHRLLRLLVTYLTNEERNRAKVVFDAYEAPAGLPNRTKFEGLQVRFADPGHDADSLIEELIAAHSAPRQIIVVSGDRRLQKAAHRRRAKFIGSVAFLEEILQRIPRRDREETAEGPHPKYDGELTSGELAHWMDLFGEADQLVEQAESGINEIPPQEPDTAEQVGEEKVNPEIDDWDDLYAELGLIEAEMAEELASEETLNRLQQEIDRMIEEEGEQGNL